VRRKNRVKVEEEYSMGEKEGLGFWFLNAWKGMVELRLYPRLLYNL
jgi:hypothetical protein